MNMKRTIKRKMPTMMSMVKTVFQGLFERTVVIKEALFCILFLFTYLGCRR